MLSGRQQQQQQSFNDTYTALILEEAEKLYNELITKLTNRVMAAAAAIRASPLPLSLPSANNNKQNIAHKNYNIYNETERTGYNNNYSEIYSNDQEQPDER
jgi:hypothetical protein